MTSKTGQAHADVVIVGGGLAGLTAACYLAQAGKSVTLYEKSSDLGGRAATQFHEDYLFNLGIHALYYGGAGERILKELNIVYTGGTPKGIYALKEGLLHLAPVNLATLLQTGLLSMGEKVELMRLFTMIPKLDAHDYRSMSVQEWIDQTAHRPVVKELLEANARTFVYSSALNVVSAEVFINKMQLAAKHPVMYIDGGWQMLVEGLRQKVTQAGAQIVSHMRVEAVHHNGEQVQGVSFNDGSRQSTSAVIVATAPADAAKLVDEAAYPGFKSLVESIVPGQLACLDVALRRLPNPHYPVVQDLEHPLFYSTQSMFSNVAPADSALIYAFKQLNPNNLGDPRDDERDLEDFLDAVQGGWRDAVVKRVYLPRIAGVSMLPTAEGGGFDGRPQAKAPGVYGLYVVGDWIGSDGFLSDASFASARYAAHDLLKVEAGLSREAAMATA